MADREDFEDFGKAVFDINKAIGDNVPGANELGKYACDTLSDVLPMEAQCAGIKASYEEEHGKPNVDAPTKLHELEKYGDSNSKAQIAEDLSMMPDLALGKIAGISGVLKDLECGGAMETSGQTDGSCRVYNAALNELDARSNSDTPTR